MVGLTDMSLKLNGRIRVGQDFGTIKYMGEVSHRSTFLFFFLINNFFLLGRWT